MSRSDRFLLGKNDREDLYADLFTNGNILQHHHGRVVQYGMNSPIKTYIGEKLKIIVKIMLNQNVNHHWKGILLMWILNTEVNAAWDINQFSDQEGLAVSGWMMYVREV